MKKQILWTTFIAVSFSPVTDAYSATVNIICSNGDQGGNEVHYQTCTSSSLSKDTVYWDGDTVTCECPTDSSMRIKYTCLAYFEEGDPADDRDQREDAYWINDGCYEVSSGGGSTGGDTTSSESTSCAAGYFDNNQTCYSCAEVTGNTNATSEEKVTSIEDCYIPQMIAMSDTTGTFAYINDCYFSCDNDPDLCNSYS